MRVITALSLDSQNSGERPVLGCQRQDPGTCWSASLAKLVSSGLVRDPVSKDKVESN